MIYNISTKIIIALIVFKGFCSYAQEIIVPLQPNNLLDIDYIRDNNAYVKDVNGYLDKFVGTWKGSYQGKQFEFIIQKYLDDSIINDFKIDVLIMRHIIKDANGIIINSTLSLAVDDPLVITGFNYQAPNSYDLIYSVEDIYCGLSGTINIKAVISNTIKLIFLPNSEFLNMMLCPGGAIPSLFPIEETMALTKQ